MTLSEKEKLTIFRICLQYGIHDLSLVERWAESIVLSSDEVRTDYMLDLCSAKRIGINETISILLNNEGNYNNPLLWKILYGFAALQYFEGIIDLEHGCYFVSEIALEMEGKTEYEVFGMALCDMFYLANMRAYRDQIDIKKEFIKITSDYQCEATSFLKDIFIQIDTNTA